MSNFLTEERIGELAAMVRERFGLNFASERWKDLRTAVLRFHREDSSFSTAAECLDYILSPTVENKDLEQFINRLTIGETFFFRDSNALRILEYEILRKLNGKGSGLNGAVRVWSTACATGEEPYTLAMICRRTGVHAEIFGTDIDSKALIKAREGCYRKWSFRSEDTGFKDIFFRKVGSNSYLLEPSIKRMVNLSRLNLMDASVPSSLKDMDVVLCRNVLMYFASDGVNAVLDKIWDCLTPGGWLVATPSESGLLSCYGKFEPVNFDGILFYRKNEDYEPQCPLLFDDSKFQEVEDFSNSPVFPVADLDDQFDFEPQPKTAAAEIDFRAEDSDFLRDRVEPEPLILLAEFNDGENLVAQAADLREQGDTAGAVCLYKKMVEQDYPPETKAAALLGIAGIKADSGLADEAALWCAKALELDRVSPCAHFLLGQIALQQGEREKGLAHMRNAVFLESEFIMAHVLLGNIYMDSGDNNGALRHFRISMQQLKKMDQEEPVPCSDSITAGRLMEMVQLVQKNLT
ncbi:protein-glutamate O-methyltransferase CheR [Desulfovibrio sp. JC022]|uniref:CheR family methyltransferase n=1 Tax=Desulfovibrio sp. JC022 TaxID=2593642 RepID=UPI0013D0E0F4|nr:protein-glutamate O-methyltransferase CheR [Desulfovibrio sp. JC022]NDV24572.1 chemotaxis protein CheR [Desulfovibrio sp. JC022]